MSCNAEIIETTKIDPLIEQVETLVLLESIDESNILEIPTPDVLIEPVGGTNLIEQVERIVLLEVGIQGPPGVGGGGCCSSVFIHDVLPVGGIVGQKTYLPDQSPADAVLETAVADCDQVDVVFFVEGGKTAYTPIAFVNGAPYAVTEQATARWFCGVARITLLTGDNIVTVTSNEGGTDTAIITRAAAGPAVQSIVFGPFPGAQTALKAGDTLAVTITTDPEATSITIDAGGANATAITLPVVGGIATGNITISGASGAQAIYVSTRNALGTKGAGMASTTLPLDQTYPTISAIAVGYPGTQGAFGAGDSGTLTATVANAELVQYASPHLLIDGPGIYAPTKLVMNTVLGYVGTGSNVTITATRIANGAVTVRTGLAAIATVPATAAITITGNPVRLASSPTGIGYEVAIAPSQALVSAPNLLASAGAWQGTWVQSGATWERTLLITDTTPRGAALFFGLSMTGLSGIAGTVITAGANYIVGGFSQRTVVFPAFSRVAPLGTAVANASKIQAQIAGGNTLTLYADNLVHTNGFYPASASGAYDAQGSCIGLSDTAFAGSNTTGTLAATVMESP